MIAYECDAGCGYANSRPGRCGGCDIGELVPKDAAEMIWAQVGPAPGAVRTWVLSDAATGEQFVGELEDFGEC